MRHLLTSPTGRLAVSLAAVATLAGCSASDESAISIEGKAAGKGAPKELVDRCQWIDHNRVPERRLREEFADPGSGALRLLLSDPVVRPGQVLSVAVLNDSSQDVTFGESSHIEDGDGRRVKIRGPLGVRLILLFAEAGGVGPCVSLPVPSDTPAGDYTAVLDDVDKNPDDRDRGRGRTEIRTDFEVAGTPIANPRWERQLRRAAQQNRRK